MGLVYNNSSDTERYLDISEQSNNSSVSNRYYTRDDLGQFDLQYPLNLDASPEYGKNKVFFFINVQGSSSIARNPSGDRRTLTYDLPRNQLYTAAGQNIKDAAQGAVDASASVLNSVSSGLGDQLKALVSPRKRLAAAIALYVPNSLTTSYNVNWQEEDLSTGAFFDELAGSVMGGVKGNTAVDQTLKNMGGVVAENAARKILAGQQYAQKAMAIAPSNTNVEQLFKGVDFRTFSFDYEFAPKSEKEARAVLDIIRMFRHHMLPEYGGKNDFLFIYPSEFDIKYYKGDQENEYLEKQITAVLTNCLINYTPTGQFTTFANGMPTHIRMQLSFKELGIPTKETSPFTGQGA